MQRAILTAPIARVFTNLETPKLFMVPGANNGTVQAYCTNDADYFIALNDGTLNGYLTWQAIPIALRKFLILVLRSDSNVASVNPGWKLWQNLNAADFVRTWSTLTGKDGATTVKLASNLLGTDRFRDWQPIHTWFGIVDDSMGDE